MHIKERMNEVQGFISKYKEILKSNPSDFSALLTLSSLERHKEELFVKLNEELSNYIKFSTNIEQDNIIPSSSTTPSENFVSVENFHNDSAEYKGNNKCKKKLIQIA